MSRHDIETAVEVAIELLDASPQKVNWNMRSLLYSLKRFEREYDTGFTNFRYIEPLVMFRYTYVCRVENHPAYNSNKRYFDNLKGFQNILRDVEGTWEPTNNPVVAYYCNPTEAWGNAYENFTILTRKWAGRSPLTNKRAIYFDVGSELWRHFVESGRLNGTDSELPLLMNILEVAGLVIDEADKLVYQDAVFFWYALLPYEIQKRMKNLPGASTHFFWKEDLNLNKIRNCAFRLECWKNVSRIPTREDFKLSHGDWSDNQEFVKFLHWWFEPLLNLE